MTIDQNQLRPHDDDNQPNSGAANRLSGVSQDEFNSLLPESVATPPTEGIPTELLPIPAEVPTVTEKTPRFSLGQKLAAGVAGIAAVGGAIGFAIHEADQNRAATTITAPNPAKTEAPAVVAVEPSPSSSPTNIPEQTAPASPESLVVIDKLPVNVIEHGMFKLLTPEQQAQVKVWEKMSVADFRAFVLVEQQAAFDDFVLRNNAPILDYRLHHPYTPSVDYIMGTPQVAMDAVATMERVVAIGSTLKFSPPDGGVYIDKDTIKKLYSLYIDPQTELGKQILEKIDASVDAYNVNMVPMTSSDKITGSIVDKETGNMVVNLTNEVGDSQSKFEPFTYTTLLDNKAVTSSRMVLSITPQDSRYITINQHP